MTSRIDSAPVRSIARRSTPRPKPPGRRHPVLEGEEEFFVELLRFFARLFEQALALHKWVVQLGVAGGDFLTVDDQLENIDDRIVLQVLLRQRDQLLRTMGHEKRIKGLLFDQLFEDMLGDFEIGHLRLHLDSELAAFCAALFAR